MFIRCDAISNFKRTVYIRNHKETPFYIININQFKHSLSYYKYTDLYFIAFFTRKHLWDILLIILHY